MSTNEWSLGAYSGQVITPVVGMKTKPAASMDFMAYAHDSDINAMVQYF